MASDRPPKDPLKREALVRAATPVAPARPFVHLRVHSAYSLLEGALRTEKIVAHAVKDRAPAIAMSDTNNLFGTLEFANKATKEGVQPLIACQIDVAFGGEPTGGRGGSRRGGVEHDPLVLIAATEQGYENLVRLVSRAYLDNPAGESIRVGIDWVEELAHGLVCLTGGPRGPIGTALRFEHADLAEGRLLRLKSIFGDRLYVELERVGNWDRRLEASTIDLAYRHELPLVATNEAFFLTREDFDAHDALIAIAEGAVVASDDRRRLTPDNHLKSQAEMAVLFADLPEAVDNTIEIAMRCSYYPKKRAPILPRFTGSGDDAERAEVDELRRQAREGLEMRFASAGLSEGFTEAEYRERLEFELGVIERMKFPGYFLIVADFIK